jgi:hypothetical protein
MFPFDPECAAHPAVGLAPVPERAVVGFERIPAPGGPSGEFTLGGHYHVGAAWRGIGRDDIHRLNSLDWLRKVLNPIHPPDANPPPARWRSQSSGQQETVP